eukprot:m.58136 g.58136  ORF g.58136 m.58136 type:complete len:107 (-) comp12829_c0_seq1:209-529(-)
MLTKASSFATLKLAVAEATAAPTVQGVRVFLALLSKDVTIGLLAEHIAALTLTALKLWMVASVALDLMTMHQQRAVVLLGNSSSQSTDDADMSWRVSCAISNLLPV